MTLDPAVAHVRNHLRLVSATAAGGAESIAERVVEAGRLLTAALEAGGRVLVAGNGGSAADAQHFAAEFTGRYHRDRRAFAAVALSTDTSALTAVANDYSFDQVFARQVHALGCPGDVFVGISTSGTSRNVLAAVHAARERALHTVLLTSTRCVDDTAADIVIRVPASLTRHIQPTHVACLHALVELVEADLLDGDAFALQPWGQVLMEGDLSAFREWVERERLRLVTTNGCFDVLHRGHVFSLHHARALGDLLVVIVNDDASVRALKGDGRPVNSIEDRVAVLGALAAVDHVIVMPDADPTRLLELLRPSVHAKGREYDSPDVAFPERAVVEAGGGTIAFLDRVEGVSTTANLARHDAR